MTAVDEKFSQASDTWRTVRAILRWLPFLLLPTLFVVAMALYLWAWSVRGPELELAICKHYVGEEDRNKCYQKLQVEGSLIRRPTAEELLSTHVPSPEPSPEEFTQPASFTTFAGVQNIQAIAKAIKAPDAADDDSAQRQADHCAAIAMSRFSLWFPEIKHEATYDSVARQIEACFVSKKARQVLSLCAGTRKQPPICGRSGEFVRHMQRFDRTKGAWATLALTLASIIYGVFQIASLALALLGFYLSALYLESLSRPRVTKIRRDQDLGTTNSAAEAAAIARREAEDAEAPKGLEVFTTIRQNFKSIVENKYRKFFEWGDIVVLIGLLGTLWGMITLFGALSESGSSEPLTAELAKSKMLGSLGLAFGTTLFAGVVRLVYVNFIPSRSGRAQEIIDHAFVAELNRVEVELEPEVDDLFDTSGVTARGRKLMAAVRLKDGSDNYFVTRSAGRGILLLGLYALIAVAIVGALLYLDALAIKLEM